MHKNAHLRDESAKRMRICTNTKGMVDDEEFSGEGLASLEDAEGVLTLLSPLSSPTVAPQWANAPVFAVGALENANYALRHDMALLPLGNEDLIEQVPSFAAVDAQTVSRPARPRRRSKRPVGYNPNRAREEQRRELQALKAEAAELEAKIAALKKMGLLPGVRGQGGNVGRVDEQVEGDKLNPLEEVVWKKTAQYHLRKRVASSLQHDELEAAVRENQIIIEQMKALLGSQSLQQAARSLAIERTFRLSELDEFEMHSGLVDQLMAGVSKSYIEIEHVFNGFIAGAAHVETFSTPEMHTDSEGNLFTRVHGSKVFPFSVEKTGAAAWAQFAESVRPNARFFFTEIQQPNEDILIERFGAELRKGDAKIALFARQVKRRFVEADRVVVVWQSKVNPIEFEGQKLKGASFDERGYFIIHRPPELPDGYALLQSCYLISPSTPMRSMPENALARNMAEFVLSWMATTIPAIHQIVEDILMGRGQVLPAAWN